jgi:hypothetical protein
VSVAVVVNGAGRTAEIALRLMLYNIRYATGTGLKLQPAAAGRRLSAPHPAATCSDITQFIASHQPDIVALVEVDLGSVCGRVAVRRN